MSQVLVCKESTAPRGRVAKKVEEIVAEAARGFDVAKLVENFEVLAAAEGGVGRLRSLVLDLAVRAALTRSSALVTSASAETVPFALADGWTWSSLEQCADVSDGPFGSKLKSEHYVSDPGYRVLRLGNIGLGEFKDDDQVFIRQQHFDDLASYHLAPNDVLVASLGNPSGRAALVPARVLPAINKADCFRARPDVARLVPAFLVSVLNSPFALNRASDLNRGDTRGRITLSHLRGTPIPLPPLAEQKRIVAKVDQLMALCDELEARQTKQREIGSRLTKSALDALTSAERPEDFEAAWKRVLGNFDALVDRAEKVGELRRIVLELGVRGWLCARASGDVKQLETAIIKERAALIAGRKTGGRGHAQDDASPAGPPFTIPEHWRWKTLADVAGHIVDGTHHTPRYVERGVDFISAKDIRNGRITFEGCRQISEDEFAELSQRCLPKRGDVLVTKSGSIGEVAIVETDHRFTLFESVALVPIVPSVDSTFASYVIYLGASGDFGAQNQRGVAVKHLHLVDLRRLPFPLPPLSEQKRIVAQVEQLMKVCDDLEARLARAEDRAARLVEAAVRELVA